MFEYSGDRIKKSSLVCLFVKFEYSFQPFDILERFYAYLEIKVSFIAFLKQEI